MQWKRMLRYLIWLMYTIATGSLAVGVTSLLCIREGLDAYWGILFAAAYAMAAAGGVFLLCRTTSGIALFADKNRSLFVVLEAILVVTLVVVGLLFRIEGIEGAAGGEIYYDMATAAMGQDIPKIVHGAVYFYIRLLHAAFTLFGYHFFVGIWIQIILQMIASTVLYFIMRKLAGAVAALMTLGCCMCAPYMVRNALMLSPEMLYFCFITAAVAVMMAGRTGKRKSLWFLFMGILIAVYGYVDIIGLLLLIPAFGVACCCQEENSSEKMKAVMFCMVGLCIGFMSCLFLDAVLCGTSMLKVIQAWFLLYSPESFRIPVAVEGVASDVEGIVLLGFMIFGIFSFWHDPEKERMTACVVAAGIIILAGSYGIFTNEMPGSFSLYVLFSVLAGVSVGQCFYVLSPEREVKIYDALSVFVLEDVDEETGVCEGDVRKEAGTGEDGVGSEIGMREIDAGPEIGMREDDIGPEIGMRKVGVGPEIGMREVGVDQKIGVEDDVHEVGMYGEDIQEEEFADLSKQKTVKYIENPLPLPKKHVKRVLDYTRVVTSGEEDFDHTIRADDDFDI